MICATIRILEGRYNVDTSERTPDEPARTTAFSPRKRRRYRSDLGARVEIGYATGQNVQADQSTRRQAMAACKSSSAASDP